MKTNDQDESLKANLGRLLKNAAAGGVLAGSVWLLKQLASRAPRSTALRRSSSHIAIIPDAEVPIPEASIVIGSFGNEEAALETIRCLAHEWSHHQYEVYSPNLNEKFFAAMNLPHSPARFWIAGGAILGQLGGWVLTIMLSVDWPHHVARMPIVAIPPFAIIAFEMMVLGGVAGGVAAVLFHCGLPSFEPSTKELRRFRQDRIGIVLNCDGYAQVKRAQALLREHGAEEIQYA
jgi:Alternative complex III, ActD subunit